MAFKPDKNLLNPHFEGYKLAETKLDFVRKCLSEAVRTAQLDSDQFSYQHLRQFALHNHLVLDPWDTERVYWHGEGNTIFCGSLNQCGEIEVTSVFSSTAGKKTDQAVNSSLIFLSPALCLFSHGEGDLQLLFTQDRTRPSAQNGSWRVVTSISACESSCIFLSARLSLADQSSLDVFFVELQDPSPKVQDVSKKNSSTCKLSWIRVKFSLPLTSIDVDLSSETLRARTTVCSVFESVSVPLHCEFIGNLLLVVNQSELRNAKIGAGDTPGVADPIEDQKKQERTSKETYSDEEMETKRYGIGYSGSQDSYSWTQTNSDVTVTTDVPTDVTKRDVLVVIERDRLVMGLSDGTTYVRGTLFGKVDVDGSTWTLDGTRLEVSLEKAFPGQQWASLCDSSPAPGLPISSGLDYDHLSPEELHLLQERIAQASGQTKGEVDDEDRPSSPKKHKPVFQSMLEECDVSDEEDAVILLFREDGSVVQRGGMGGRQVLFTLPWTTKSSSQLCVRHDVDALLWSPLLPSDDDAQLSWSHVGTFNALGYVQASKRDKKFLTCSPEAKIAALSDCNRHIFVYRQPEQGVSGNKALQYVHTLESTQGEILGLQATSSGLVFVLCQQELTVLLVDKSH